MRGKPVTIMGQIVPGSVSNGNGKATAGRVMSAVRWSTAALPRARQFGYWREMVCEALLGISSETAVRDGFRGDIALRPLGALAVARIGSQAQSVRRTEADIAGSGQPGYCVNLQLSGTGRTSQDGRVAITGPGELTIIDKSQPFTLEFGDDYRQLSFHVPESLLRVQLDRPVPTATRIATITGVGAALRHTLQVLGQGGLTESSAGRLAVHACGLVAVAADEPAALGPAGRYRAGQLDAALADIAEHLADDDLCPATTAARLGISVRHLHQLFAGHERTFGAEARRQRLEQAHRDLADPARSGFRVADIAAEAGFADVTHFHRVFRQAFGYTPAGLRRQSGAGPAGPARARRGRAAAV
jgi:AraC family transcriptional activator of tynA and feaB